MRTILLEAKKHQVFINIDAEHYPIRDLVFEIWKKVININLTNQFYLTQSLLKLIKKSKKGSIKLFSKIKNKINDLDHPQKLRFLGFFCVLSLITITE